MTVDQTPRRPGTLGTSDRFRDAAGRLWKLTRKGWRHVAVKAAREAQGRDGT